MVTEHEDLGQSPDELMESLVVQPGPAELPPPAGSAEDVMVPRSVRWPLELDLRVKKAAVDRGLTMSQLMREWAEAELAILENDRPISRADALRALASLRPVDGAA